MEQAIMLPDFLTRDAEGLIHFAGHRISLDDMVHFFRLGETPEMLHCRFPTVPVPAFYKAAAYYLENRAEIDDYCLRNEEMVAKQRLESQSKGPSLDELRTRHATQRLPQGA